MDVIQHHRDAVVDKPADEETTTSSPDVDRLSDRNE
jgi:hypothetical protein